MFRNVVEVWGSGSGGVIVLPVHFCSAALDPWTRRHGNHYVGQLALEHFGNLGGIY